MPIRKHLTDKAAFGPAAIEAMSKAFEETCIALQVSAGDEKGREIIATRIIDLARSGLIDPAALRDRVITEARLSEWRDDRNDQRSALVRYLLPCRCGSLTSLYRRGCRGCRGFRALVLSAAGKTLDGLTAPGSDAAALGPRTALQSTD
jgi:hypothetical protein